MWQQYVATNFDTPLTAAFVQFLLLGTLGEVVSRRIRGGEPQAMSVSKVLLKALGWGVLGLYIKFMFVVSSAGTAALFAKGYLPGEAAPGSVPYALAVSAVMNVFLGPSMMIMHRVWDNGVDRLLDGKAGSYAGLRGSLATLVWMWIPLHTITFTQPVELRIGIAAFLSLLLGVVMGVFARGKQA